MEYSVTHYTHTICMIEIIAPIKYNQTSNQSHKKDLRSYIKGWEGERHGYKKVTVVSPLYILAFDVDCKSHLWVCCSVSTIVFMRRKLYLRQMQ